MIAGLKALSTGRRHQVYMKEKDIYSPISGMEQSLLSARFLSGWETLNPGH